jgi:hypothetical protein
MTVRIHVDTISIPDSDPKIYHALFLGDTFGTYRRQENTPSLAESWNGLSINKLRSQALALHDDDDDDDDDDEE